MKKILFLITVIIFSSGFAKYNGDLHTSNDDNLVEISFDRYKKNNDFDYLYDEAFDALEATNKIRKKVGVKPLSMDRDLLEGAMLRSLEVKVLFDHIRPNGKDIYTAVEDNDSFVWYSENIALGMISGTDAVERLWFNSPGHYRAMIDPDVNLAGMGFTAFPSSGVQLFGTGKGNIVTRDDYPARKKIKENIFIKKEYIQLNANMNYHLYVLEKNDISVVSKTTFAPQATPINTFFPISSDQLSYTALTDNVKIVGNDLIGLKPGKAKIKITHNPTNISIIEEFNFEEPSFWCEKEGWNQTSLGWIYCEGGNYNQFKNKWKYIAKKWYYFDSNGVSETDKWKKSGSNWYYLQKSGAALKSEFGIINGKKYYFNEKSIMETGWTKVNSFWYFMEDNGEVKSNTWIKSGRTWYYLKDNGASAKSQWINLKNQWYRFGADSKMIKGWEKVNDLWYWFDDSGLMIDSQWKKSGNKWYYMKESGAAAKSQWLQKDNNWYRFNSKSEMVTGWEYINNSWYLFEKSGVMEKSQWVKSGTKWYYLLDSGAAAKSGVYLINNKWYEFDKNSVLI